MSHELESSEYYIKYLMFLMRKLGVDRIEFTLAELEAWLAEDERQGRMAVVAHGHRDSIELLLMREREARQYAALADAAVQGNG